MAASSNTEIEVKIPIPGGFAPWRARLAALGFRLSARRLFESNELFDTADSGLRSNGCLLRLRRVGRKSVLTFKGPPQAGRHKVREELEMPVADEAKFRLILERLGYRPGFRYEKYRAEYTDGRGIVMLDETPIGNYLELEGPAPWIDRTAAKLGFDEAAYVTKSYGRLYMEHCESTGETPAHMTFPAASRRKPRQ